MKITNAAYRNVCDPTVIWRMSSGRLVRVMRVREETEELHARYVSGSGEGFGMRIPTFLRAAQVVATVGVRELKETRAESVKGRRK